MSYDSNFITDANTQINSLITASQALITSYNMQITQLTSNLATLNTNLTNETANLASLQARQTAYGSIVAGYTLS